MKYLLTILLFCLTQANQVPEEPKFTAYVFIAEECPVCNYVGKTLKKISTEFQNDVKFVAVFPQRISSLETANRFIEKYDLSNFEIKLDTDHLITNRYNAMVTPEVVLVNSNDNIVYKGRINDSYASPGRIRHGKVTEDLNNAIDLVLQNKTVDKPWYDPVGCYITKK
jgi:thiol-disulfide isomerase/thioredoxin